ncbi:hypothetical protein G0Q06_03295 [Puniceicoccales bacterium CK1056]|uniref:Uncharacterized protein n=1 Tax=Oceanipulchritudo coccoides TaxID=2706888 RepID=A0A6B2LZJ5_9BACT|nr:dienelactone hydrolase family protein [Oceanipulchritudo coccoides]NDV61469.1 hypothetical protein [Oceanipulchritudo coccoides]
MKIRHLTSQGIWAMLLALVSGVAAQAALPSILYQTETVYIWTGQSDELTLDVPNNVNYTYQWYAGTKGDTSQPISGATQIGYTTPNLTETTNYWVRLTNNDGSLDSETMTIIPVNSVADLPRAEQMIIKLPDGVNIDTSKVADKFLLYLPQTFDASPELPLLIHLHGAGNQNEHVSKLRVNQGTEFEPGNPFQLIAVRPRSNGGWNLSEMNLLLNYLKTEFKVDEDRVYASGYSMGAAGVWRWTLSELESGRNTFSAVGVMAGNTGSYDRSLALAMTQNHVPFWIFHGDQDQTVNIRPAKEMSEYLTRSGSEAKFTVFPGFTHGIAGEPAKIGDDDFLKWMVQQRRRDRSLPSEKILSLNFYESAVNAQLIDSSESFGVESLGTLAGNWNNTTGTASAGSLILDDGSTSSVELSTIQPEGSRNFNAGPHSPMEAGLNRTASTSGPVSVTLSNLNTDFPNGYYAIVYLTGEKPTYEFPLDTNGDPIPDGNGKSYVINKATPGNTGATITDGASTFYFQSPDLMHSSLVRLTDPSPVFHYFNYPLQRTSQTSPPAADYPEATFVVFGPYSDDAVTFTLDNIAGEDAAIGGIQVFDLAALPLSPDPAEFSAVPNPGSPNEVTMSSVTGLTSVGTVEYFFTETTGNFGGTSSGWQSSIDYTDTGLLPQTTYAYTVTMRDSLGNITAASDSVVVTTPGYESASSPILLAWHTPDEGTNPSTPDTTPDYVLPGISGSIAGGKEVKTNANSTDDSFGTLPFPDSPLTANAVKLQTSNAEQSTLTLTITNNTGGDIVLDSLRFDYSRAFAPAAKDMDVSYQSGDLDLSGTPSVFSFIGNTGDVLGNTGDYADVDADLTVLDDYTLANSESATFQIVIANADNTTSAFNIDNIAFTQAAGSDMDGDGIPNTIEESWGLNPDLKSDGALDLDGDGQSNYSEYVAGTQGDDPSDFLNLLLSWTGAGQFEISPSIETGGRLYILDYSPDLQGMWQSIDALDSDVVSPVTFQVLAASGADFFRIRIIKKP